MTIALRIINFKFIPNQLHQQTGSTQQRAYGLSYFMLITRRTVKLTDLNCIHALPKVITEKLTGFTIIKYLPAKFKAIAYQSGLRALP
jgi:hypothetical protein